MTDHLMSTTWDPHFDNGYDIHTSSQKFEGSGYGLDLDLLTILPQTPHTFQILIIKVTRLHW